MEALGPLAPAITEVNILMDMRLIEIDQVMVLIACAIQQRADAGDKGLALLRLGATEQLAGLLPGQFEAVQCPADGLATAAPGKLRPHRSEERRGGKEGGSRWVA